VIQEIPDLSDKLLEAFQTRRTMLERSGFVGVRLFGHVGDPDVTVIREFFDKNKVPHTWIDADATDGRAALESLGVSPDQLPFVSCNRGTRSPRPTVTRLAECLGLKRQISTEPFDLVIIGAGPAGLAAAVYGASEGLRTIVLDRFGPGGQAGSSSRIENYMGFPAGMTGADLANRGYLQALKFGAELVAPVEVRSMTCEGKIHRLVLDDGQIVRGRSVLIATGATYQRLPVVGCERWDGVCIYYSCTTVHARACQSARAAVVGGGNSAGQAVMFLADHTPGAVLLLRGGDIRKSMSDYLARRIERHSKIEVICHVEVDAVERDHAITHLRLRGVKGGDTRELDCSAVFVFIGAQPRTDWLPPSVAVDSKGFILTGADAAKSDRWPLTDREPCIVETTCPGVFAAGDVRSGTTKRVAFAVGDGALAVTCAHRVLAEIGATS
jgi:thioredoxin reductase (NADPH)